MFCSLYKITFERVSLPDIVLLDFGQAMDRELDLSGAGLVQSVPFAGAAQQGVFGRGNESFTIGFSRFTDWASHQEAQEKALEKSSTIPLGVKGTLLIQVEGGASYRADAFVLETKRFYPAIRPGFALREDYSGTGSQLSLV